MKPAASKPATVGRALGTGARLLGRRIAQTTTAPAPPPPSEAEARAAAERSRRAGETLGRRTRNVGRGSRAFGRAVWNPFAEASSVLWLEITGMFFTLFAVLFGQHLWTLRAAYRTGSEHARFLVYALFTLLFAYFAVSSFARARRRARPRSH